MLPLNERRVCSTGRERLSSLILLARCSAAHRSTGDAGSSASLSEEVDEWADEETSSSSQSGPCALALRRCG